MWWKIGAVTARIQFGNLQLTGGYYIIVATLTTPVV